MTTSTESLTDVIAEMPSGLDDADHGVVVGSSAAASDAAMERLLDANDFSEPAFEESTMVSVSVDGEADPLDDRFHFSWRKLLKFSGPGVLMSIAYLDPGNLEGDLQAGAQAGYQLLWVLLLSTLFGGVLQTLSLRLGVVTGNHLAEHCRTQYPRPVRLTLWLMTEVAIIGSDIQEVVGSAIAINILTLGYVPLWAGTLLTAVDTFAFLFLENYGVRRLELFFGFLVSVMAITFGIEYGISAPPQLEVFLGCVWPRLEERNLQQAIGLIGAVIMPHNLYLHSALVQSRKIDRRSAPQIHEANVYNTIESFGALFISFIINLFVVSVFANAFHGTPGADKIGLRRAGDLLGEKYFPAAKYIWAVGLLAAGQSSTMTGTYAGQFVMQGFLNLHLAPWKRVMITRSVAILPSVLVAALLTSELDALDEWLNVLQSVQLPFALIPVLTFTSNDVIMGQFRNNSVFSVFVWLLAIAVIGLNIKLVIGQLPHILWVQILSTVLGFFYLLFIFYLLFAHLRTTRPYAWCHRRFGSFLPSALGPAETIIVRPVPKRVHRKADKEDAEDDIDPPATSDKVSLLSHAI